MRGIVKKLKEIFIGNDERLKAEIVDQVVESKVVEPEVGKVEVIELGEKRNGYPIKIGKIKNIESQLEAHKKNMEAINTVFPERLFDEDYGNGVVRIENTLYRMDGTRDKYIGQLVKGVDITTFLIKKIEKDVLDGANVFAASDMIRELTSLCREANTIKKANESGMKKRNEKEAQEKMRLENIEAIEEANKYLEENVDLPDAPLTYSEVDIEDNVNLKEASCVEDVIAFKEARQILDEVDQALNLPNELASKSFEATVSERELDN